MVILTNSGTADKIQVVTGSAVNLDVVASWVDLTSAGAWDSAGRQVTAITTAATTDVLAGPASGKFRNLKTMTARNKSAGSSDVTVLMDVAGTDYELAKVTVPGGATLMYDSALGSFYLIENLSTFSPAVSVADQVVGASTTAYLTSSGIALAGVPLKAGTVFVWDVYLIKSGAATASMTFDLRVGTAGTTSDTSRGSLATGTQTAVADVGHLQVQATIRSISATGTLHCGMELAHNLAATGLGPTANIVTQSTSGTFDTTATNLIFGLSLTTSTSHSITIQQIVGIVKNIPGASI